MKDRLSQPDRSRLILLPKPAWHLRFKRPEVYAIGVALSTIQIYDSYINAINGISERLLSGEIKKIASGSASLTNHYIPHTARLMDILG